MKEIDVDDRDFDWVTYRLKYTNGTEMNVIFTGEREAQAFIHLEGDHLVEYERVETSDD
jgi:hypothetical protein